MRLGASEEMVRKAKKDYSTKWSDYEQQLFFVSFEVAWNLGRLESQDGETAVNQAAQEIAPVGQFVGLFWYWLDKVLRGKTAVLLDFVQFTFPPPPNLDNLYNFFLTPKTSIYLTFKMTPYPKFFLNKGRILALWVMYTT